MKRVLATLQACMLVVLMAATGEAGDSALEIHYNFKIIGENGNLLMQCDEDYQKCLGPLVDQMVDRSACYQRMREAMKAMDGSIQAEQRINKNVKGEKVYVLPDNETYKQWNDTMESCVK